MIAPQPAGEPLRVLWLTSRPGTPSSVQPDLELARQLARAAIDVHIIAPADSCFAQAARQAGLTVVGYPPRGLLGRVGRQHVRSYCRAQDIQLVHLLDAFATVAVLPALSDAPVPVVARHARVGGVQRWNPMARLTVLHPRLDRVICTSEAARMALARRRSPASVTTIRPGYDLDWYDERPADLARLGIPADAFAIAVATDYRGRMGIEYIVDAAQWLPLDSRAHFLLIGAGHENRSVLERISRSPLRERFHLLGPRFDAPRITAACAVSVRAALRGDDVPQAIMAAMACGVTPLMTDTGAAQELVEQGESGVIVPRRSARAIGEALAWLCAHPAACRTMGLAARARIAGGFSLAHAVASHQALYRELCASGRTQPGDRL